MGIVINGTTIPTNVANAIKANNIDITKVICNSITVWEQSLFSGVWSGGNTDFDFNYYSSYCYNSGDVFQYSGSSYRYILEVADWFTVIYGGWLTCNSSGMAVGSSYVTEMNPSPRGITTTSNTLRYLYGSPVSTWIIFDPVSKFTGVSYVNGYYGYGMDTASGFFRMRTNYAQGAWVTLS